MGRRWVTVVVLAAVIAGGRVDVQAQEAARAVRPADHDINALIARGMERSATFQALIRRLDEADVTVYVTFAPCTGRVRACLQWASTTPGVRRLLIKVDRFGGSPDSLTALLAHELQHACEVAERPAIIDLASFRNIFASFGRKGTHGFETDEAVAVARKVLAEVSQRPSGLPRQRPQPRTPVHPGDDN